jgi:DNA mismatch endonuclease (patch repair protein)
MQANRRRDTSPELAVRKLVHAAGFRYRVDFRVVPELRTRADLAFTRTRIAVFIDGCFWHSCPEHGTRPKSNADYWIPKLARNVQRDRTTDAALESLGWRVLRFWEHEEPQKVATQIATAIREACPA